MSAGENQIVVYQPNETVRLDVRLENETVWLTQSQMATLFGCSTDNVGLHLKNIYSCGELDKKATTEESSVVQVEGQRKVSRRVYLYNLDAIISVGYRVNSILGVKFRQWATRVLKEYLLRGYSVNIDAYPGVATLDMLAKRGRGVKIELVTHSNGELEESDFEAFGAQCGKFTKTICGICHDRFIIVDQKEIFWTGASLKDAGRLTFAAAKMGAEIIPGLLESIRKATSERREYGKGRAKSRG